MEATKKGRKHETHKRLKYEDRQRMESLCRQNTSVTQIAETLGVHVATVYRELQRGGGKETYQADRAQRAIS